MGLFDWFTTAASNDHSGALWPENMPRADVNNSARQMQADIRAWANDPGWIEYGDGDGPATIAFASATSFTVAGANITAIYHAGRAVKAMGSSTGTIYGRITSSSFSTDTTVNVEWDDGGALQNETLTVWIAALPQLNPQLPAVVLQRPNLLPNGEFVIWQEGTSITAATTPANNDDTYVADGCILLSQGHGIADISQDTVTKPNGAYAGLKALVVTANVKFGFLFPIEGREAAAFAPNGKASLSFKARKGGSNATLETVRAAVLAWSGTSDSITSDAVSTWQFAGTDPVLVTNWTYENAPFSITLGNSFKEYRINNIATDTSGTTNVAVFIWVDDTDAAVGDELYLADVSLVSGEVATPIMRQDIERTISRCERLFQKSYNLADRPAATTTNGSQVLRAGATAIDMPIEFKVRMRTAPSVTLYSPTTGASGVVRNFSGSSDVVASAVQPSERGFYAAVTGQTENDRLGFHFTASARL